LTTSPPPRVRVPRHVTRLIASLVVDYFASCRLVIDYFAFAARPGASARHAARRTARRRLLHLAQARCRLLRLRHASGCLGTSRRSSRGSSRRSLSTTLPRAGSSLTTSPPLRVWVPRHVARLVTRLVALLFVNYSASGGSSSTTSPTTRVRVPWHVAWLISPLLVDIFAYVVRPCASAHRTAHRRLLRLCRASGCLDTPRGSSRGSSRSSSTTSPTPRVRVPRHVARLVVDYFDYAARPVASARHAACRVTHR
jgi:hypothetical protein